MPTFIKTGYWETAVKSYKGWLNLEELITNTVPSQATIYTENGALTGNRTVTMGAFTLSFDGGIYIKHSTQSQLISTYFGNGADGNNIWIGGGGLLSGTDGGASFNGSRNTSLGKDALLANTGGRSNTAVGTFALATNTTGFANTAIGVSSLRYNTTGLQNSAMGNNALSANTSGSYNLGIGGSSLTSNTSGGYNSSIGTNSLLLNTSGNNNTAIGNNAGYGTGANANTTGTNNIFIGHQSVGVSSTESNRTWIGNSSTTSTWLGGKLLIGTTTVATSLVRIVGLPTSSAGLASGELWNNAGVVNIIP